MLTLRTETLEALIKGEEQQSDFSVDSVLRELRAATCILVAAQPFLGGNCTLKLALFYNQITQARRWPTNCTREYGTCNIAGCRSHHRHNQKRSLIAFASRWHTPIQQRQHTMIDRPLLCALCTGRSRTLRMSLCCTTSTS